MSRPSIKFESGSFYHIWTHAVGNENLFRDYTNYQFFLEKYDLYLNPVVKTYAYCLMPNHFHFMIQVREDPIKESSRSFSNLLNSYTQAFNKMYQRRGSLFISNIKRRKIEEDAYFTRCITYIHQNPTHHGFIQDFRNWKFSSWRAFLTDKTTKLEKDAVFYWFGGTDGFLKDHEVFFGEKEELIFGGQI